jgi:23S rRNA (uridine2552-2'-O)-methyltransferase
MTRWYQQRKHEHFYREAKRRGYRARSAFKLKEIHRRFELFSSGDIVLDLGAAPGGWSQIAREYVGSNGQVIGVDRMGITPLQGVDFLQGDVSDPVTVEKINEYLSGKQVDIVLSDMSPDISGTYSVDQARSVWLCEQALTLAQELLKPGGHFVCKLFEGEDSHLFLEKLKRRFYIVKPFSPKASRTSSSEIYLIAKSLKTNGSIENIE